MEKITIFENELVPVYVTDTGEHVVDGRELWEALKVKTDFSTWIKRRFDECIAVENKDYSSFLKNGEREIGGTTRIEYIIKLNTAKEMAMLERNEVGKAVRKYFINVEEKYIQSKTKTIPQGKQLLALALVEANKMLEEKEVQNAQLQAKIEEDRPKVVFADAIAVSDTCILIRNLVKILKQKGIDTGEKRFFKWLRENGYLMKAGGVDWNTPTQKAMNLKLFEIRESVAYTGHGVKISFTTYVTTKGQMYFIDKLLNKSKEQLQLSL